MQSKHLGRKNVRTGSALRFAGWLLTVTVFGLVGFAGMPCEAFEPSAVKHASMRSSLGAIGANQQPQPGPCPEYIQPVEIRLPAGALLSIETSSGWSQSRPGPLRMQLVVGAAYRLKITAIPLNDGAEVFPSLRILGALDTPPGQSWRFPVEIDIHEDDLNLAIEGTLVRRIVYAVHDSNDVENVGGFDVRPLDDPFEVAKTLGDPLAEVILGNRVPPLNDALISTVGKVNR
ncbi:MAG: hypothetical protein DWH80_06150 [Planctomycetota bacterium]|nr:MAG: hypothetical protein DWH80_06150 [Planctomycetota bacterium]